MFDLYNTWCSLRKREFVTLLALFIIFFGTVANAQVINLPETGQTTCYLA
jgi:hypothetical protein